jgi:hypothetical protein
MRKFLSITALIVAAAVSAERASGVELLGNRGLEESVSPPGWIQMEFITGEPSTPISLSEHVSDGSSPEDPGPNPLGILVRTREGNVGPFMDQNKMINYTLEQTVPTSGVAGNAFTFAGDAFLAVGYSGAVDFLDALSPSDPMGTGTVPSPTETTFEVAFLNATNQVIGTPTVLDLRDGITPDAWQTYMLTTPQAPVGTTQVRVKVAATNIVDNFGGQALNFDQFSLIRSGQTINRLTNGNLNEPGQPADWTLTETPAGVDSGSFIGFAHHATPTNPSGRGLWVRAFVNGDVALEQTVPAQPGGNYTFSAFTAWESNYAGDGDLFPGTTVDNLLEMTFLNASNAVIGSPIVLNLDDAGMNNDEDGGDIDADDWRQFSVMGTAPAGTANVRVGVRVTGLTEVSGPKLSAFYDDFSLQGPATGNASDKDGDGDVDGNDFLLIQRGLGNQYSAADITAWKAAFGATAVGAVGAVPEPTAAVIAATLALCGTALSRKQRA